MAFGDVNLEGEAAGHGDVVAVFVDMFVVAVAVDVRAVGVGVDHPTLEVVVVVAGSVGGVHLIVAGRYGRVGAVGDVAGFDDGALLVEVGDGVGLEEECVEVSLGAVGDAGVEPSLYGGAHAVEGQGGGEVGGGVGGVGGPAFAGHAGGHGAHAGVIDDGVVVALRDVGFLDIERYGGAVGAVEGDFQACVVARFGDDIDREGGGGEGDAPVFGSDGCHVFEAVAALVVNVEQLAVDEVGVFDGDECGLVGLGLPLAAVLSDVDVVGAQEAFAVGGGALDGSGTDRRVLHAPDLEGGG